MKLTTASVEELLQRSVVDIVKKDSLIKKLESGKTLRIKHGIDPTAKDLHLGHCINYIKMRQFQNLGHQIIFLIGDFTAQIGDPTNQSQTRPMLSKSQVEENVNSIIAQIGKVLDLSKTEIVKNSNWYSKMKLADFLKLASYFSHQQLIERAMFQDRIKLAKPIFIHELVYPILQAYDSVMIKSDLTIIGTDQLYNEMQARTLQQTFGQQPQDIITVPLLVGTDGANKMSQSLNNYINIVESPNQMYAKIMSIDDQSVFDYFTLLTNLPLAKIRQLQKNLSFGKIHPLELKKELAYQIVSKFHNVGQAIGAKKHFELVFTNRKLPKNVASYQMGQETAKILDILIESQLVTSKTEAKRLLSNDAIEVDGEVVNNPKTIIDLKNQPILKVGKKSFLKIIP